MNNEKTDIMPDVLMFIGRFSTNGSWLRTEVIDAFLFGCCWWFAYILSVRFAENDPRIMVDYISNHFGCKIGEEVYDITGVVTNDYFWQPWDECDDDTVIRRITEDCIMF